MRQLVCLFACVGMSATVVACSDDTLTEEEFADSYGDGGECVAAYIYDEVDDETATDLYGKKAGSDDDELTEEARDLLTEAQESCAEE